MKTIVLGFEPCCSEMNKAIVNIMQIKSIDGSKRVEFGVRITKIALWIKYCPWCGKEINLKVID